MGVWNELLNIISTAQTVAFPVMAVCGLIAMLRQPSDIENDERSSMRSLSYPSHS